MINEIKQVAPCQKESKSYGAAITCVHPDVAAVLADWEKTLGAATLAGLIRKGMTLGYDIPTLGFAPRVRCVRGYANCRAYQAVAEG